jgi:hypothetical protein
MGFVIIGGVLVVLFIVTVFWKRRENARIDAILRAGAAGEMHDVNVQGRLDPRLAAVYDPGSHTSPGGFYVAR